MQEGGVRWEQEHQPRIQFRRGLSGSQGKELDGHQNLLCKLVSSGWPSLLNSPFNPSIYGWIVRRNRLDGEWALWELK
jgi:hypothetical protein